MTRDNHYGVWYKFLENEEEGVKEFNKYINTGINGLKSYNHRDACFSSFNYKYRVTYDCYLSVSSPCWFNKVIDEINKCNNIKVTVPMQLDLWTKLTERNTGWNTEFLESWSKENNGGKLFHFPLFHIQVSDKYTKTGRFYVMGFMCYLLRAFTLGERYCGELFDDPQVDNYLKYVFDRNNLFVLRGMNGHNLYEKEMTLDIFNLFDNVDLINNVYTERIPDRWGNTGVNSYFQPTPVIDYLLNNKDKYLPKLEIVKPKRVRKLK